MTAVLRPASRLAGLAALLAGCLAVLVLYAGPARADDQTVTLGAEAPRAVTVVAGERVTFVNGEDRSHRVRSAQGGASWNFDSGELGRGQSAFFVFPSAGTYAYTDARAGSLLPLEPARDQPGSVSVQAAPAPAPAAAPPAPAAPAPAGPAPVAPGAAPAAPAPAPAAPAPAVPPPVATGGTGTADLPGLVGGFQLPPPLGADAPVTPPSVAGLLGEQPGMAGARRGTVLAVDGPLPGSPTSRPLGLPAAAAGLLAAGVVSLLARLLLAEPAARPERVRGLVPVALD